MKSNPRMVVVMILAVLCLVVGLTAIAQISKTPPHPKWEYRDGANLQIEQMNAIGEEGWELVEVVTFGQDYYYIFKRPK